MYYTRENKIHSLKKREKREKERAVLARRS
jgi:hypothetical protein